MNTTMFRCFGCDAKFVHQGPEDDCPTVEGRCGQLIEGGWKPVRSQIMFDYPMGKKKPLHLISRGGWICAECVRRYLPMRGP